MEHADTSLRLSGICAWSGRTAAKRLGLHALSGAALVCLCISAGSADDDRRELAWLYDRLKAPEPGIRVAAAKDLGAFRPVYRGALLQLMQALSDQNVEVRAAVQEALSALAKVKGFGKAARGLSRGPRAISLPRPHYPDAALGAKLEGKVLVELVVQPDGRVTHARVLKSVPGLDEAAIAAAEQFVFVPAVKDGQLVGAIVHAPITFSGGS